MKIEKKQYNFYLSYWESLKALTTDKEKVEFMTILNEIYFFEKHIDKIEIKSPNVKLLFTSVKHSIKTSIQGYCDKKAIDYNSLFDPIEPPCQPPIEPPCQQLIKNKEQYNNKKLEKDPYGQFKNILLTKEEYSKLQELYSSKLSEAIEFLSSSIESKGYKYKSHYAVMNKNQWVYKKIMIEENKPSSTIINKLARI